MKSVIPLDMALGIANLPFKISIQMMLEIAKQAINIHSYGDLQKAYEHDLGISLSDDEIRSIVKEVGRTVYQYDEEQCAKVLKQNALGKENRQDPSTDLSQVLYIQIFSTSFKTRGKKNEETSHENKIGAVFNSTDVLHCKTTTGEIFQKIKQREFINHIGETEAFNIKLYSVALRHGLENAQTVVILSDNICAAKTFSDTCCKEVNIVHILDLAHLEEKINQFANTFVKGKEERELWVKSMMKLLKSAQIDDALKLAKLHTNLKKPLSQKILTYIEENREGMGYQSFLKSDYIIGSNSLDDGSRPAINNRLNLSGMRWEIEAAKYVSTLKCKYDSGLWESVVEPLIFKKYVG